MKVSHTPRRRLPDNVAVAIELVLAHFWQAQAQDYLARSREEQDTHIFAEMLTVRQWLKGYRSAERGKRGT